MNCRIVGRVAVAFVGVVLGGSALAGCSPEQQAKPNPTMGSEAETVTVSTTVTVPADGSSDSAEGARGGDAAPKPKPTPKPTRQSAASNKTVEEASAEAIAEANRIAPSSQYGGEWVVSDSNFDPGNDLSYAFLNNTGMRSTSLVALFHKGEFVQFASDTPGDIDYAKAADGGVECGLHDTEAFLASGEPLANSSNFNKPVLFYWDGNKVARRG
nr:hypothetical protein [Corynebacterium lactis]